MSKISKHVIGGRNGPVLLDWVKAHRYRNYVHFLTQSLQIGIQKAGIGSVTARTYRVLEDDVS